MKDQVKIGVFYEHICEASQQFGIPLIEMLKAVSEIGIQGVECEMCRLEEEPEVFKEQLVSAGLEVSGIYAFFDFGKVYDINKIQQLIALAEDVGTKHLLIIPGFINDDQKMQKEQVLELMVSALQKICELAAEKGLIVTLEDFDDYHAPFSTDDELLWFIEKVPLLKCTFDTGNFIYQGIDSCMAFEKLKDHIVHVHCKDRYVISQLGSTPSYTVNGKVIYPGAVGQGIIPFDKILNKLIQQKYSGYLVIEHFGVKNQLECICKSTKWLNTYLQGRY